MPGMAFGGGIVTQRALQCVFGGVELERGMVHFDRDTAELDLAVGIGSRLKIEMVKSAHAVGDVHLHGRVIDRLRIDAGDGQFERARANWHRQSREFARLRAASLPDWLWIRLSLSADEERDQNETKKTCSSVHIEQLYGEDF